MAASPADVLANRHWLRCTWPFPHVVAHGVFTDEFYHALAAQFGEILDAGLSEVPAVGRFCRSIPGYDAYGIGLDESASGPAAIFVSSAWRDLLSGLFDVGTTPYVFAGAHHHVPGSRNGFIHTDLNAVYFPRARNGRIQSPRQELCAYKTGAGPLAAADRVEVVRGAAMIFYLLNDGWRPGDGGETGLYASSEAAVTAPSARCPPEDNSLIAFECTPRSYHAFLSNRRLPRTTIIMWVHRTVEEAVRRHGEGSLERWKS